MQVLLSWCDKAFAGWTTLGAGPGGPACRPVLVLDFAEDEDRAVDHPLPDGAGPPAPRWTPTREAPRWNPNQSCWRCADGSSGLHVLLETAAALGERRLVLLGGGWAAYVVNLLGLTELYPNIVVDD